MRAVRLSFLHMLACLRRDRMLLAACAAPVLAGLFFRFRHPLFRSRLNGVAAPPGGAFALLQAD